MINLNLYHTIDPVYYGVYCKLNIDQKINYRNALKDLYGSMFISLHG